jgi:dipeptidyl aminopeptidase/acylaminoacyl peptidase
LSLAVLLPGLAVAAMQPEAKTAPFGAWESPVTASQLADSAVRLGDVRVADGKAYWLESRPAEAGRYVVVTPDAKGGIAEVTPASFSARTRVHEYGGAAYTVSRDTLFFSHWADQRLYAQKSGAQPVALTPEGYRYADCVPHPGGAQLFCVREDHTGKGEARNTIVAVPTAGGSAGTVLFSDSDFVAYPRLSRDGKRLAWIAWNHPDMPWDTTTLYVADLSGDRLSGIRKVAGGNEESVLEPSWDADGTLYFISDRSDWWNLYRWSDGKVQPVAPMQAEFASPLWALGQANYALLGDGRAVVKHSVKAVDALALLDLKSGVLQRIDLPFSSLDDIHLLSSGSVVAIAASGRAEPAVIQVDLATRKHRVLRSPSKVALDPALISVGEPIEFPTANGLTAHAFYYAPTNPAYSASTGEKPPLLVKVHGGPTAHAKAVLDPAIQYWTSRGFAVADVNYGGSSAYGRRYRQRLNGNWGVTDLEDVVAVVKYLTAAGRIDPKRAAIRGGSAGGYTTLAALAFRDVFKAGANYYGVSDLTLLAQDTHKFESRYLDRLVAPLPAGKAIYDARSPLQHLEGFNEPLITFQGAEDKVVPPNQSHAIVAALKKKGMPVAYMEFEGEQHGFRKADTLVRSLEAELYFYGKVFGFVPAGNLRPVKIDNLREKTSS